MNFRRNAKYRFLLISTGLVLALCLGGAIYADWRSFFKTPIIPVGKTVDYVVSPGDTIVKVAFDLQSMGYLIQPRHLIWYARLTGQTRQIKAGEYLFKGGILPKDLIKQVINGEVLQRHLTIIEGWNFKHITQALTRAPRLTHSQFSTHPAILMNKLGSIYTNPEGLFFPATYPYYMGNEDYMILKTAYKKMQRILLYEWNARDMSVPYNTPYEALIVASMIEKEVKMPEERALVASVIRNRLKKSMRLQIDQTVIYGMGEQYQGSLTRTDLHTPSPYNTYLIKGLPPTPIAMPSRASLHAALHPAYTNDLYYVAKGDGSHIFSSDLKSHNKAVAQYIAYRKILMNESMLWLLLDKTSNK